MFAQPIALSFTVALIVQAVCLGYAQASTPTRNAPRVDAAAAARAKDSTGLDQHDRTDALLKRRPAPVQHRSLARRNLWLPTYNRDISHQNNPSIEEVQRASLNTSSATGAGVPSYSLIGAAAATPTQDSPSSGSLATIQVKSSASGKTIARSFVMPEGTVLVNDALAVNMKTADHEVSVKPGTIAYFVHLGNDTAVLNLSGERRESVVVESGGGKHKYDVPVGTALIITKDELDRSAVSKFIPWLNPIATARDDASHIYRAGFPYTSALGSSSQFQDCLRSSDSAKQAVADKLLKIAAASLIAGR